MDGLMPAMLTGVAIIVGAFLVVGIVRNRMKKKSDELNRPPEVVEAEMQELVAKAKADMEKEKKAEEEKNE
ncbi:hypothetical protein FWF89_01915 [Candidatus Saccharibacteria bacterium]|nr:hypothetical protein [Candidatus Saccharibacteria bacterium]